MKSTGNIAVSATAETGRSMRSRDALTGRKRSFTAGENPLATDGRHRQDLRLNRTPEYEFPICTSILGSRPAFETTVLQPAERLMIPHRHIDLGTRKSLMTVGINTDFHCSGSGGTTLAACTASTAARTVQPQFSCGVPITYWLECRVRITASSTCLAERRERSCTGL